MSNLVSRAFNYIFGVRPNNSSLLLSVTNKSIILNQIKYRHTKHWNPKFKQFRKEKVIKVKLPDFNEYDENVSQEKMKAKFKEQGLLPSRPWIEKPIFIGCTGSIFEPYVPPEGDVRKIRTFDEEFSIGEFEDESQQIYLKAHEAMAKKFNTILLIRPYIGPSMNHWNLPVLCMPVTLAVYDRFGRLIHGSEIVKKDVLEYVVFEKHIANQYGTWRIHAKIIPPWMPEKEHAKRTYVLQPESPDDEDDNAAKKDSSSEALQTAPITKNDPQPQINT
ncbi:Similar to mRpL45: Probable 39S ribosomal protein L45 [Cotesia congregata]|uniref:Mitochondrial (Drosophila melanogaster) n=1 Tax=Cotesia congregata TaxID=51543 RepID=A0A8J2H3U7_COTCN|nr:Similar to mRpL45: Probable 39S ribosomal protein L45 [Cotesia congregata]